jgi:hypothetical protein
MVLSLVIIGLAITPEPLTTLPSRTSSNRSRLGCLITPGYGGRVYFPTGKGSSPCRCGRSPAASPGPPIPIPAHQEIS